MPEWWPIRRETFALREGNIVVPVLLKAPAPPPPPPTPPIKKQDIHAMQLDAPAILGRDRG